MRSSTKTIAMLAISVVLAWPHPSAANVVDDAWGIATDPLKIGKAADAAKDLAASVERTMTELQAMESTANQDVKARIEQVAQIVNGVTTAVDQNVDDIGRIVDDSLKQIRDLEAKTNEDAVKFLYRGQCVAQVAVTQQLSDAIKTATDSLNQAKPGLFAFGWRIISWGSDPVSFKDPDVAYRELRETYFQRLNDIKPDDDAYVFVSTYQNLIRVSKLARCHYLDQGLAVYFDREANELERLSAPWDQFVKL